MAHHLTADCHSHGHPTRASDGHQLVAIIARVKPLDAASLAGDQLVAFVARVKPLDAASPSVDHFYVRC